MSVDSQRNVGKVCPNNTSGEQKGGMEGAITAVATTSINSGQQIPLFEVYTPAVAIQGAFSEFKFGDSVTSMGNSSAPNSLRNRRVAVLDEEQNDDHHHTTQAMPRRGTAAGLALARKMSMSIREANESSSDATLFHLQHIAISAKFS